MSNLYHKIISFVLVFMLFLSPIAAIPAKAQWVVWDPGNFVPNVSGQIKDYGLDTVAWVIVNLVIERMAASTVNWINSGFKGKPAFITDPGKYYKDIGDKIAGQYIFSNPNLNFLCGPISAQVRLTLAQNYIQDNRIWQCKLTDAIGNMEDFLDDFNKGGWDKFFTMTQNPTQNPIGAYLMAENQLRTEINTRQGYKQQELLAGRGFMSFKECVRWQIPSDPPAELGTIVGDTFDENGIPIDSPPDSPEPGEDDELESIQRAANVKPVCAEERTATPGSVIENKLNEVLGVGNQKLAAADEINEIVSALLNQLITKVVGGVGKGLSSLSKPDNTNNSQIFTSQLVNRTPGDPIQDYFGSTTDTSILDVPPDPSNYGVNVDNLVDPRDVVGGGQTQGAQPKTNIRPNDSDCVGVSQLTIEAEAQKKVDDGTFGTLEGAVLYYDCSPEGIN